MATVASLLVRIAADSSSFESGMSGASSTLENVGNKMGKVGKSLTKKVTLPLLGLGIAAIKIGADFDAQMSKVSAISGAVGKDFDKLRQQARDLGATTSFSAVEAAEGMEFLARAGFDVDEVMSAMPSVLSLSAAGALDLASAADITSNVLSGFGMEASRAADVADVLALASASSNTNVEQLGTAMSFVAPLAKSLGVSMEEASAAVGIFSDAGIQGTRAGTALRGGLTRLVKPSKQAKKVMKDLGFEAFDQQGNFIGLEKVVGRLEKSTASMTQEQKSQAVATIFGQEAMSGWLALLDRGSVDLKTFTTELENSGGAAEKMAKIMKDNLTGKLEILQSTIKDTAIEISDLLSPSVEKFVEDLTKLLQKFNDLDDETKKTILLFLGLAAAIGPVLIGLSLLIKSVRIVKTVFKVFSKLASVLGMSSAALLGWIVVIALLIAAAVWVIKNWDKVVEFFQKDFKKMLKNGIVAVKNFIKKVIDWFKILPEKIGFWLGQMAQKAPEQLGKMFFSILPWFLKITGLAGKSGQDLVDGFIDNLKKLPKLIIKIMFGITEFLATLPLKLLKAGWNIGAAIIKGFKEGFAASKVGIEDFEEATFIGPKLPKQLSPEIDRMKKDIESISKISMPGIKGVSPLEKLAQQFRKKEELKSTIPQIKDISIMGLLKSMSQKKPYVPTTRTPIVQEQSETNPFIINVATMNVRDEQDTEKIAQSLYRLQQNKLRASGVMA